jgi:hypothetical protein
MFRGAVQMNAIRVRDVAPHHRWIPWLVSTWILLQAGDLVTTYWGLSYSAIVEANPVMAPVIHLPGCVVLIKMGLAVGAAALILKFRDTPFPSLPLLLFLNGFMFLVCASNAALIVEQTGPSLGSLIGVLLPCAV